MKKEIPFLRLISASARIQFKEGKVFLLAWGLVGILNGLFVGVITFALAGFFNAVTMAVDGTLSPTDVYQALLVFALVYLISQLLSILQNVIGGASYHKSLAYFEMEINKKAERLEPICFENKEMLDDITKANIGAEKVLIMVPLIFYMSTFFLSYFLFMGTYLYTLDPQLILIIVAVFIPVLLTQVIRMKMFAKLAEERGPLVRQFEYYEKCVCDREYFKETRLLGGFTFFKSKYSGALEMLGRKVWETEFKVGARELGMRTITLLGYALVLVLLFSSLLNGEIAVGEFAAVFSSIGILFGMMDNLVREYGRLSSDIGTAVSFIRYLDLPERTGADVEMNAGNGVELVGASFYYPGAEKPSLEDINLSVKKGDTVAIVGGNGAGKTTLVRLMSGIYQPTNGVVKIDGYDTKEVSSNSVFKNVSVVFQKFQKYKLNLKENITISNTEDENNTVKLSESTKKADVEVNSDIYPNGYDTMLSREFDGVDLSGGQWQRVAIARGFYRQSDLIILDEPTAAVDPLEETKLYNKFAEISKDNTAVLVTHRLGSAKIADRIIVMDEGKIVETGSHDELIGIEGGKYSEMYNAQAKWYVADKAVVS